MNPKTKQTWEGYYAFNVIGLISAANMDASDYDTLMTGSPDNVNLPLVAFRTIVLDEKRSKGLKDYSNCVEELRKRL